MLKILKNFKKKKNLYICKQSQMMAYEGYENASDNFDKFVN